MVKTTLAITTYFYRAWVSSLNDNLGSMAQNLKKSMVLDGIAASEAIDSSGEILDIKGLDISSLEEGTGVLNYEHRGDNSEGASANDIIGHITYAKKIFGPDDCANDRELSYWNKVNLPFVYIQAELFDSEGHPGAQAAAALIRYYQRRKMPILMRYSIEGSTIQRDGNKLKRAIAKRVAATIKPCNRSCESGVLSDDKAEAEKSKDALADLVRFENPERRSLGGYEGEFEPVVADPLESMRDAIESLKEVNALNKAMSVGGGEGAPMSLTGGAALQAESIDGEKRKKFLKNQVMAAVRDWRGRGDLQKFLKHRLPDASDDFIEHFAKLVDDYRLKKMMELEDNLAKAVAGKKIGPAHETQTPEPLAAAPREKTKPQAALEQHHATVQAAQEEEGDDQPFDEKSTKPLTIRGRHIRAIGSITGAHFDERKGVLFTPRGSFRMYLPQNDPYPGALEAFHNALNDPKTSEVHNHATANWMKVHKMLKDGSLSPEIIMHSTLFSQLSPNTPVPMQELMYSHLVDTMKEKGVDARDPRFAQLKDEWMSRDTGSRYPENGRDYFQGAMKGGVHLKNPSYLKEQQYIDGKQKYRAVRDEQGNKILLRPKGAMGAFMLANNKFVNMEQYHQLHHSLVDLFGRHKHDARGAVEELMAHKHAASLWEARRAREIDKGRADPGPYADGPDVPGLAPKTGRYMAAMIGGGNVVVPDTHFTRYLFGLEKGVDDNSIKYLKSVLWNDANAHVLNGIDRYFAQHHPSVQHVMDHPTFGKHFADREDAIFPAFWKTWISIAPHERARRMKTMAFNEATDHRPFWEAISPFVKSEIDDIEKSDTSIDLPMRTARLHADWVKRFGEVPAQMLYYMHIVPQLIRASRRTENVIVKMERLAETLRKAGEAMTAEPQLPPVPHDDTAGVHKFMDNHVKPGVIEIIQGPSKGSRFHYLGGNGTSLFTRPMNGETEKINSIPKDWKGKTYRIISEPTNVQLSNYVDSNVHGDKLNLTFPQKELPHGVNLAEKQAQAHTGISKTNSLTGWYRNMKGTLGYVKPDLNGDISWVDPDHSYVRAQQSYPLPNREVLVHNMARDFFGLGAHVPNTALFYHPQTRGPMSMMQRVVGGQHYDGDDDDHGAILDRAFTDGSLDKLALMDAMMGQNDRNPCNYMLTNRAPGVHLIDNGLALDYKQPYNNQMLWEHQNNDSPTENEDVGIHPAATRWMRGLSPVLFMQHLNRHGVPHEITKTAFLRMRALQSRAQMAEQRGELLRRGDIINLINSMASK
jgi:hypothetical protein